MTKEEKDVLENEPTEVLDEVDTGVEDAVVEADVQDNPVEDNYSSSNPFMYTVESVEKEEPVFEYNMNNESDLENTQDAFNYVENEVKNDNSADVHNAFAYSYDNVSQDNSVSNDFTYADYTNNQMVQQENSSFEYNEVPVVEEKKEQNPTIYEPNVKFSTEDEIRSKEKNNFTFMLIFTIIMIAMIIALPYIAKI